MDQEKIFEYFSITVCLSCYEVDLCLCFSPHEHPHKSYCRHCVPVVTKQVTDKVKPAQLEQVSNLFAEILKMDDVQDKIDDARRQLPVAERMNFVHQQALEALFNDITTGQK